MQQGIAPTNIKYWDPQFMLVYSDIHLALEPYFVDFQICCGGLKFLLDIQVVISYSEPDEYEAQGQSMHPSKRRSISPRAAHIPKYRTWKTHTHKRDLNDPLGTHARTRTSTRTRTLYPVPHLRTTHSNHSNTIQSI